MTKLTKKVVVRNQSFEILISDEEAKKIKEGLKDMDSGFLEIKSYFINVRDIVGVVPIVRHMSEEINL